MGRFPVVKKLDIAFRTSTTFPEDEMVVTGSFCKNSFWDTGWYPPSFSHTRTASRMEPPPAPAVHGVPCFPSPPPPPPEEVAALAEAYG